MRSRRARLTAVAGVLAVSLGLVLAGLAFWTTVGSGSTPVSVAGLTSPSPSATSPSAGLVQISWSPVTLDPPSPSVDAEVTFVVERSPAGAGTWVFVCGTGTTPLPYDELSCEDSPSATNTYDYRVTGRLRSWTAEGTATVWVTVDTTPPSSKVTFPAAGVYSAASWDAGCASSVCGTAADTGDSGLHQVEVAIRQGAGAYWDGSAFASAEETWNVASGTGMWAYGLAASSFLADGQYSVASRAADNARNVELPAAPVSFTIDTTPPSITASALAASVGTGAAGFAKQGTGYRVYADVSDANGVSAVTADVTSLTSGASAVALDACTGGCTVGGHAYAYRSDELTADGSLTEGPAEYDLVAVDVVGNTSTPASYGVLVDNTAPSLATAIAATTGASPEGFVKQGGTYRVYATAADAGSGVDAASLTADVSAITAGQTAVGLSACGACGPGLAYGYSSAELTAAMPLAEGAKTFSAEVRDDLGSSALATAGVQVDNTAPAISAVIAATTGTSPEGFVKQGGTYRVYATATDTGSGVDPGGVTADVSSLTTGQTAVVLTACGGCGPGATYGYASASITADGTLPEANRLFTATGRDNLGYAAASSGSVRVDNTAPAVSAVLASTATNEPGWLAQGAAYRVYANATELPQGAGAASGLAAASPTADVSAMTSGLTVVALTTSGCPCVVGGTTYAYRTPALTADSSLAGGPRSFTASASDNLGSTTVHSDSVIVDNAAPALSALEMFDADDDGRVDQVRAEFDETLTSYSAGSAPWVLANAPGGAANTVASVSVSSQTVILTLDEGIVNTAAGSFAVALAASANGVRDRAGNQASFGPSPVADRAAPVPTNVVLANGTTLGQARSQDTLTVTYSEALDAASFCSTWSNGGTRTIAGNGVVDVLIANAAGNDVLTVANVGANCGGATSFRFGSVALGANYVTANTTFSGNGANQGELVWNPAARTLTITLGGGSGSQTNVPASTPVYMPSTVLDDLATPSNSMSATVFSAPATSRF